MLSPNRTEMSLQPEPRAKRQRTTFLDNGKPDLNPAAPSQPDISSSRRPVYQQHPTSTAGPPARAHEGPIRKRERVAVNGNYIGYYRRRREVQHGELDDRLELVPREWIRGKRVLDVGANAGEVSIELAQRFRAAEVVGVDIDPELTQQARRNGDFNPPFFSVHSCPLTPIRLLPVDLAWSRQAPIPRLTEDAKRLRRGEATSIAEDPSESATDLTVEDSAYFPTSLARMFGFLPHPRGLVRSYTESNAVSPRRNRRDANYVEHLFFPENIVFETADWVNTPLQADRDGYDVIFAYAFPSLPRPRWARADSEPFATLQSLRDKVDPSPRPQPRPPCLLPTMLRLPPTGRTPHPRAAAFRDVCQERQGHARVARAVRQAPRGRGEGVET